MNAIIERILKLMEGIESDPNYVIKSWILGQIAGNIAKNTTVWKIHGYAEGSGEVLEEVLDTLEITYKKLTCKDNIFTVEVE